MRTTCWFPLSWVLHWLCWCSSWSWPTLLAGKEVMRATRPSNLVYSSSQIVGTTDFCSHLDSATPPQLQLPSFYPALPSADVSPAIAQVDLRFLDFLLYYGIINAYLMVQVKIKGVFEALGHAKVLFPGTRLSLSRGMPGVCCYLCLIRVRKHMICLVPHILTFNLMRLFI